MQLTHKALAAIVPILFAACGDSSSSGPDSSGSSSSQGTSSSSVVTDIPGTSAAARSDLPDVVQLPDQDGLTRKYLFSSTPEAGVFSKIIGNSQGNLAQLSGTFTWNDGVFTLDTLDCIRFDEGIDSLCTGNWAETMLNFRLRNDSLFVSVQGKELEAVSAGTLRLNPVRLSDAGDVEGRWIRRNGDTTDTWDFLSGGGYAFSRVLGASSIVETGLYDIQNNYLLLASDLCTGTCYSLRFATPTKSGDTLELGVLGLGDWSLLPTAAGDTLSKASLAGTWQGKRPDSLLWQMELEDNGSGYFSVYHTTGGAVAYQDSVAWSVYGDLLVIDLSDGGVCEGDGSVGLNGGSSCFSYFAASATLSGDTLNFASGYGPTIWERQ